MPKLLGFDVWIEMEGVKLPEYKAQTKNGEREVSCWISCETGKDIRIGCALPRESVRSQHHQLEFYLDGRRAYLGGSIVEKEPHALTGVVYRFDEEHFEDGGLFRTFQIQFGNLELTDDETYLRDSGSTSELGEIRVVVYSVGELVDDARKPGAGVYQGSGSRRVHERSKKCLKHCVRLGKEKKRYVPAGASVRPVNRRLICTFVFKYRHLDMLMADEIVPPKLPKKRIIISSSGSRSNQLARVSRKRRFHEVDEDPEYDSEIEKTDKDIEIRRLRAQLAALEQQLGNGRTPKRIKKESTSTLIPGEVIDLTI